MPTDHYIACVWVCKSDAVYRTYLEEGGGGNVCHAGIVDKFRQNATILADLF